MAEVATASAVALPQVAPPSVAPSGDADVALGRQIFSVELKPGETTIVSWKKLLREAAPAGGGVHAQADPGPPPLVPPALAKSTENDILEPPPQPNRFNSVIEKIERLYMGKQSSDEEELDDVPDEDEYDTEDSFIDDTELDEYFEVDNLTTKHDGYFVNKGKLEQVSEPGTSTDAAPKKRRRKEFNILPEKEKTLRPISHAHTGSIPANPDARNASNAEKKLPINNLSSYNEYYYEGDNAGKSKLAASSGTQKKKPDDAGLHPENSMHMKANKESLGAEIKGHDMNKTGTSKAIETVHKSKATSGSYGYAYPAYREKESSFQIDFQSRKLLNGENESAMTKVQRKEKHRSGTGEFNDLSTSTSYYANAMHPAPGRDREMSSIRPKSSKLERAIRDLESIVAQCRPPNLVIQEVDPSGQVVKRRLPREVKQKLAYIARLSVNQVKVPEEVLIDRLMGIVGHLVQRKTLKRNLKDMVELGLSERQQKAGRFEQIKTEIIEMIKVQVSSQKLKVKEQQDGSADDFQDVGGYSQRSLQGKFLMDTTLEDKICDLYDLYLEGIDEDKGAHSRKLYLELAELWPQGCMDNFGIKDAISRSKDRRRSLFQHHKVRNEERLKRKRLRTAQLEAASNHAIQTQAIQQHAIADYSGQVIAAGQHHPMLPVTNYGQHYYQQKPFNKPREIGPANPAEVKKKKRRLQPMAAGEVQAHPQVPQIAKEKQKSQKHAGDSSSAAYYPQPVAPVLGLPSYDKVS